MGESRCRGGSVNRQLRSWTGRCLARSGVLTRCLVVATGGTDRRRPSAVWPDVRRHSTGPASAAIVVESRPWKVKRATGQIKEKATLPKRPTTRGHRPTTGPLLSFRARLARDHAYLLTSAEKMDKNAPPPSPPQKKTNKIYDRVHNAGSMTFLSSPIFLGNDDAPLVGEGHN